MPKRRQDPATRRAPRVPVKPGAKTELPGLVEKHLIERHTPPAVVIDRKGDIIYVHGRTGRYLEPPAGFARTANVIEMARPLLKSQLPALIRAAVAEKTVSSQIVKPAWNGQEAPVRITVEPVSDPEQKALFIVLFEDMPVEEEKKKPATEGTLKEPDSLRIDRLEKELHSTRDSLQTTIEELETSNEELRSINEEYQSANEELNSSKEEMQSLNEELETVNAELQSKNQDLTKANDDMKNLMDSLALPTVFLDNHRAQNEAGGIEL